MSRMPGRNLRWRLAVAAAMALGTVAALAPSTGATSSKPDNGDKQAKGEKQEKGDKPAKQRPFRGYVQGFVTVQLAPGFPNARSTFNGRCSTPSDWIANWSGTGTSTQTGGLTAYGSDCDRVNLATGELVYDDGVITEWDKHGNYIYATYTNGHGILGGAISDEWTIVGGTGRYEGATGHGFEDFILLAPPSLTGGPIPFNNPWDGWISFGDSKSD